MSDPWYEAPEFDPATLGGGGTGGPAWGDLGGIDLASAIGGGDGGGDWTGGGGGAPYGYPAGGYPELTPSPWEEDIAAAVPIGGDYGEVPEVPYEMPAGGALKGWTRGGPGGTEVTFDPGEWVAFFETTHPGRIQNILEMDAERLGKIIKDTMQRLAPKDTGLLANTIAMEVDKSQGDIKVRVFPTQPYAGAVETGTPPHSPPIQSLAGWAARHGIPVGALWNAIREHGTAPHPYIEPTMESVDIQLQNVDIWGEVFGTGGGIGGRAAGALGAMAGQAAHWIGNLF